MNLLTRLIKSYLPTIAKYIIWRHKAIICYYLLYKPYYLLFKVSECICDKNWLILDNIGFLTAFLTDIFSRYCIVKTSLTTGRYTLFTFIKHHNLKRDRKIPEYKYRKICIIQERRI